MAARRFVVRGVVQGVGFRYAARREALRLGLHGWVRNRADGSVEAVALGDEAPLDALQRWLRRGPPGAHVDSAEAAALTHDEVMRLRPPVDDSFRQVETAWD